MPPKPLRSTARRRAPGSKASRAIARSVIDGVRRLNRGLRLAARRVERETGLSAAQLFMLYHLAEAPAKSLKDLAARTFTDRSSVSAVVDRLEKADLVTRTSSPHDGRQQLIRINGRGIRKLAAAPPAPADLLLEAMGKLPRADAVRLGKALAALNTVLGFQAATLLFDSD